jgi:hypothetical protein
MSVLRAGRFIAYSPAFAKGGSGLIGNSGRKTANVCDKHAKDTIRIIATHFIVPAFNILLRKSGSEVPEDIPKEGQGAMSADSWHLAV